MDKILRQKAAERHTSLNSILLDALEKEAGLGGASVVHDDLDALIGSWVSDPAVDAALSAARKLHPRDWE